MRETWIPPEEDGPEQSPAAEQTPVGLCLKQESARPAEAHCCLRPPIVWYDALTFSERLVFSAGRDVDAPTERGHALLDYWRKQTAAGFDGWLAYRGAEPGQLLQLLGEPPARLRERLPRVPSWMRLLLRAYGAQHLNPLTAGPAQIVLPLVHFAHRHLRRCLARLSFVATEVLLDGLSEQLERALERVLVLEMHIARRRCPLEGSTPTDRWLNFIAAVSQPAAAFSLLQEYPVLARVLAEEVRCRLTVGVEFATHLHRDLPQLLRLFRIKRADRVVRVERVGDRHRGGRCVLIVEFTSGSRLVYKPRSLSVDVHFQQVLGWLNRQGMPTFRVLRILDRGDHGWVEYVRFRPCRSLGQVERFYRRMGGYLAVLYILGGTDMFYENVIAHGEQPILVDLEGLLQPLVATADRFSVRSIGLLPCRVLSDDRREAVDVSALGAAPGQRLPKSRPQWQEPGTDQMRLVYRRTGRVSAWHRPHLQDRPAPVADSLDSLLAGFEETYRLILCRRDVWLAADGPLAQFTEDEVRVFCRPTWIYKKLLNESLVPWRLRHGLLREGWFGRLWARPFPAAGGSAAVDCECRELDRGDIPRFSTRTGSRDLLSGSVCIPDAFACSGLEAARARLHTLGEVDLRRQQEWVRAAILQTVPPGHRPPDGG